MRACMAIFLISKEAAVPETLQARYDQCFAFTGQDKSMQIPYRHSEKIKLNQYTKAPLKNQIDAARVVLILLPEKPGPRDWAQLAYADTLKSRYQQLKRQDKQASLLITDLPNKIGTRVILQTLTTQAPTYELLTTARKLAGKVRQQDPGGCLTLKCSRD